MKSFLYLAFFSIGVLLLTSCLSPKTIMDDDVYVVKNSALPVGESLNDESSYSSYRYKKDNNLLISSVYKNDQVYQTIFFNNSFYRNYMKMFGQSAYWNRRQFHDYGYGFNYAFMGNSYLGYYGSLYYLNCTSGNNYDNGFYASTGYLATPEFSKSFTGPRFSFGGYSNQFTRSYSFKLKSTSDNKGKNPIIVAGNSKNVNYPVGSQLKINERKITGNNATDSKINYKPTNRGNLGSQQSVQSNGSHTSHPNHTVTSGRNQSSRNQVINEPSQRGNKSTINSGNSGNKHETSGRRN